jgi:hypothetical protein
MMTTENNEVEQQEEQVVEEEEQQEQVQQYLTAEQVQQIVRNQTTTLQSELRGAIGKIDSGLNAIRRDTSADLDRHMQALQQRGQLAAVLSNIPEENREWMEPLVQTLLAQQQAQAPQSMPTETAQPQQASTNDWLLQVVEQVRDFGVDPADPRLNWKALLAGDEQGFRRNLGDISRSGPASAGAKQPQQAQQRQGQRTQNNSENPPPVRGGGASGYRNIDDVRSAYIEDRIDLATAQKIASSLGHQI